MWLITLYHYLNSLILASSYNSIYLKVNFTDYRYSKMSGIKSKSKHNSNGISNAIFNRFVTDILIYSVTILSNPAAWTGKPVRYADSKG